MADTKKTKLLDKLTDTQDIRVETLLDQLNKSKERMTEPVPGMPGPTYRQYSDTPKIAPAASDVTKKSTPSLSDAIKTPGLSNVKVPGAPSLSLDSPEVDRKAYETAVGEAALKQEMATKDFNKAKSTTDWLRVAETVGKALLRMGAAQQGLRDNVDLSNVGTGPGTDWASLLQEDAAIRDMSVSDAKTKLAGEKELQSLREDEAKSLADLRNREKMAAYQQSLQDRDRALDINRQNELERYRAEKSAADSEKELLGRMQLEKTKQEAEQAKPDPLAAKLAKEQSEAAARLYTAIEQDDEKAIKQAQLDLSKAGFTPEQISAAMKASEGPGFFDRLLGRGKEPGKGVLEALGQSPAPASDVPAAGSDPKIAAYASQNGIPYAKAQEILVKRGYKPQ